MAVNIADYFKAHLATPDLALYRQSSGDAWADVSVADLALLIGRSSEAPRKYCVPFTSRSFCRARLVDGPGAVPIMHWQH